MIRSPSSRTSSSAEALLGLVLLASTAIPCQAAAPRTQDLLLSRPYPIVVTVSFPGGLFHWIDSLAGTSAGKTITGHREEYLRHFGALTAEDRRHIGKFLAARADHRDRLRAQGITPTISAMLGLFCASESIEDALGAVQPHLDRASYEGLAAALAWFKPKYERIWSGGEVPASFLARARMDPELKRLERILARMVRFYDVAPKTVAPPRVALVPVPEGYGTHAEAIGSVLLLEIRPGEGLATQASVLVHENAHFLWGLLPAERRDRLAEAIRGLPEGSRAWSVLSEALPTALGQGVADRAFNPRQWSTAYDWYHTRDVDRGAKRIYGLVERALRERDVLDEAFLRQAFEAMSAHRALTPPAP